MKRFIFCLVASGTVVLYLRTALWERPAREASGKQYWDIILTGRGRELLREDGRVYFHIQGHHGWRYSWVDGDAVDTARAEAVQEHLQLLRPPFSTVERSLFGILAGETFEDDARMAAWLGDGVAAEALTAERVAAFLIERERICRIIAAALEKGGTEPDIGFWGTPYTAVLRYASNLYPPGSDRWGAA